MRGTVFLRRTYARAFALAVLVVGVAVVSAAPALASGPMIIDNFAAGAGSWQACGNSFFVYQQDPSIIGGARELAMRDGGSCHFGPFPAQMSINTTSGTASWGGPNTYAPEQHFSYGTEIGTQANVPWSPNPNGGKGTPLHLALGLSDEIVIQMQQVNNPFMAIELRDGNGATYQVGIALTVGTNLVPLSSFPGLTAAAASDIDGISFTGSNKNPTDVVSLFAIQRGDTDPPVAAPTQTPAANGNGWNTSDVTVNWNWTDAGSGIDPANCTQSSTSTGEGTITLTSTCADLAGNSASDSVTVNVDKTAPADSPVVSPAANANGWNNTDVSVAWNWTDGGSGIDAANCTQSSTSTGEGTVTLTSTCSDLAGNTASDSVTVKVDKTAPTVTYSGNQGSYTVADTIAITCSASDALSGIATSTCANTGGPAWSFALGSHTLSATATDKADNSGSGSASFTVTVDANSLCTLVRRFSTKDGVAKSLCEKLAEAARQAAHHHGDDGHDGGDGNDGSRHILDAFAHEVKAQSGKAFTASQAALLVQLSASI